MSAHRLVRELAIGRIASSCMLTRASAMTKSCCVRRRRRAASRAPRANDRVRERAAAVAELPMRGVPTRRRRPAGASKLRCARASQSAMRPRQRSASASTRRSSPSISARTRRASAPRSACSSTLARSLPSSACAPRARSAAIARSRSPPRSKCSREDRRVALAVRFEPRAREPVRERAIVVGEHRVRRLANERVPERELVLAGEAALACARVTSSRRTSSSSHSRRRARSRFDAADVCDSHRATPERFAEHARRAKHATRLGLERVEAPLDHREHRSRARRRRAPRRPRAGSLRGRTRCPRRVATTRSIVSLLASSPSTCRASRALAFGVSSPSGSSSRLALDHKRREDASFTSGRASASTMSGRSAWAPSAQSTSCTVGRSPQCKSSRTITTGAARGFSADPVFPRAAHLVAHQLRVATRGAQLHAVIVGESRADDLAEEFRDALHGIVSADVSRRLRARRRRTCGDRGLARDRCRPRAARAGPRARTARRRSSDRRARSTPRLRSSTCGSTRSADAISRRPRDAVTSDAARDIVVLRTRRASRRGTRAHDRARRTASACRGACARACRVGFSSTSSSDCPTARDDERRPEEARGRLVDRDGAWSVLRRHVSDGAIDHVADRSAADFCATRRERDGHAAEHVARSRARRRRAARRANPSRSRRPASTATIATGSISSRAPCRSAMSRERGALLLEEDGVDLATQSSTRRSPSPSRAATTTLTMRRSRSVSIALETAAERRSEPRTSSTDRS